MVPILFQSGPVIVYTHDLFTTLGLLAGLVLYYRELRRRALLGWPIVVVSIAAIVGGGVGARLITAWEHWPYYTNPDGLPWTVLIAHSGKSIIGGIAGGYLAIACSKRLLHYRRSTGDCYAAALPVAMIIGRIGCFLSELPLGRPTDLPWGLTVSEEAARQFAVCPGCQGKMHPSMLYEILFHGGALLLILRYRHLVTVQGDLLKVYLLAAALFRFLVEFLRANPEQFAGLTGPQIVLGPLTLLLIVHFVRQLRRGVYRLPAAPLALALDNRSVTSGATAGMTSDETPIVRRVGT